MILSGSATHSKRGKDWALWSSRNWIDRRLEIDDGSEDSLLETPLRWGGEEALDSVEPRGRGRREVEGSSARMARQPLPDSRMLVGGVIVEDGVDSLSWLGSRARRHSRSG